jgi:hypothetical protein
MLCVQSTCLQKRARFNEALEHQPEPTKMIYNGRFIMAMM